MSNDVRTLLIDDKRERVILAGRETIPTAIARNYDTALIQLSKNGPWDILFIDHDLGDFHNDREWTGYDIVCWLEQHPQFVPRKIVCVSQNPSGRQRINQAIQQLT